MDKKKFINSKFKYFEKLLKTSENNDIKYLQSLKEYVNYGVKSFDYEVMIFDEKKLTHYDNLKILNFTLRNFKSKGIVLFNNDRNYLDLLNGYYVIILYNILNLKNKQLAPAVLSTDLSLIFILALTYFPKESDLVGRQLIRFLNYHKSREEEKKHYKGRMKEMFGYSDVVWLSSIISKYYGKEDLSKEINEYCNKTINPTYKKAIDNLFSKDKSVVNEWVNELVEFHIKNSKSDLTLPFNHEEWQYYPIEIISLLEIRLREGLEIDFIENEFLEHFLPYLGITIPIKLDEFTLNLKNRILY
ncbi:hypothetical protein [Algibacter lectus]|uniref:hypothetical protein n=1 Tax=Algibacter lectus TaxID=221126 RepID=UPI00249479CD|nr:hypothetical protein [Algibacter lectus]